MSDKLGEAYVEIRAKLDKLDQDFRAGGKSIKQGLQNELGNLPGIGSLAPWATMAAAIAAVTREFSLAATASEDQAKADRKLEAVIRATGGAAGLTAKQLKDHASALQSSVGIADDAIEGLQTRLLIYKNIHGDVFTRATELALDMSTIMENGLEGAAMALGMALNSPAEGLGRLSKQGIKFTNEEEKMLKKLEESNRLLEAQKFILDKVAGSFGGAAAALANDGSWGSLKVRRMELEELRESIGDNLVGAWRLALSVQIRFAESLDLVMKAVGPLIQRVADLDEASGGLVTRMALFTIGAIALAGSLVALSGAMAMFSTATGAALLAGTGGWAALLIPLGLVLAAIVGIVVWLMKTKPVQQSMAMLAIQLRNVWESIVKFVKSATPALSSMLSMLKEVVPLLKLLDLAEVWKDGVPKALGDFLEKIATGAATFSVLVDRADLAWKAIALGANYLQARIMEIFRNLGEGIQNFFDSIRTNMIALLDTAISVFEKLKAFDFAGAKAVGLAGLAKIAIPNPFADLGREMPATRRLAEEFGKAIAELGVKIGEKLGMKADEAAKKDEPKKREVEPIKGLFGPEALWKKLQEAQLKDTDAKMLDVAGKALEVDKEALKEAKGMRADFKKWPGIKFEVAMP